MSSTQKEVACSKRELLLLLKQVGEGKSQDLAAAMAIEERAERALANYERSSRTLCSLRANVRQASDAVSRLRIRERKKRDRDIRECRNAIYLDGATPQTVATVRRLLEKYNQP